MIKWPLIYTDGLPLQVGLEVACCGAVWEWVESFSNFLKNPAAGSVLLTLTYALQVILGCQILHTNFVKLTAHIYFWDCITEVEWYML